MNSLEMSKEVKVRWVRCPRCLGLLREPEEHPVYRCGSCETLIQAKIQKTGCVDSETDLGNTTLQQGVVLVNESKRSLNHDTSSDIGSSSNECSEVSLKRKGKGKLVEDDNIQNEEAEQDGDKIVDACNSLEFDNQESTLAPRREEEIMYNHSLSENDDSNRDIIDTVRPDSPLSDSHVYLYLTSDNEHRDFSRYRRNGWFDTSPGTDFSSEIDLKHKSMSKSSVTGSYYAYDGNESCYDGMDDHKLDKSLRLLRKDMLSNVENYLQASSLDHEMNRRTGRDIKRSPHKLRDVSIADLHTGRSSVPGFDSSDKSKQLKPNEMDILRKIQELEDQLNGISKLSLHTKLPVEREVFSDHLLRHACPKESTRHEGQSSCSCLNCSSNLPLHYKSDHHFLHSDHSSGDVPRYVCTRHDTRMDHTSMGIETNNEEMKRVNPRNVKRQILPLGGGAPFVTCYFCWELLQLPSEFISTKKRYKKKLLCGACKKILKF